MANAGDYRDMLTDYEKEQYANMSIGMMWADGKIDKAEIKQLVERLKFIPQFDSLEKITKHIKEFMAFRKDQATGIHYPELPSFTHLKIKQDLGVPNIAFQLFIDLGYMGISDGDFDDLEMTYFMYLGHKLGFTKNKINDLIQWLEDNLKEDAHSSKIGERIKSLFEKVIKEKPDYPTQAEKILQDARTLLKDRFLSGSVTLDQRWLTK